MPLAVDPPGYAPNNGWKLESMQPGQSVYIPPRRDRNGNMVPGNFIYANNPFFGTLMNGPPPTSFDPTAMAVSRSTVTRTPSEHLAKQLASRDTNRSKGRQSSTDSGKRHSGHFRHSRRDPVGSRASTVSSASKENSSDSESDSSSEDGTATDRSESSSSSSSSGSSTSSGNSSSTAGQRPSRPRRKVAKKSKKPGRHSSKYDKQSKPNTSPFGPSTTSLLEQSSSTSPLESTLAVVPVDLSRPPVIPHFARPTSTSSPMPLCSPTSLKTSPIVMAVNPESHSIRYNSNNPSTVARSPSQLSIYTSVTSQPGSVSPQYSQSPSFVSASSSVGVRTFAPASPNPNTATRIYLRAQSHESKIASPAPYERPRETLETPTSSALLGGSPLALSPSPDRRSSQLFHSIPEIESRPALNDCLSTPGTESILAPHSESEIAYLGHALFPSPNAANSSPRVPVSIKRPSEASGISRRVPDADGYIGRDASLDHKERLRTSRERTIITYHATHSEDSENDSESDEETIYIEPVVELQFDDESFLFGEEELYRDAPNAITAAYEAATDRLRPGHILRIPIHGRRSRVFSVIASYLLGNRVVPLGIKYTPDVLTGYTSAQSVDPHEVLLQEAIFYGFRCLQESLREELDEIRMQAMQTAATLSDTRRTGRKSRTRPSLPMPLLASVLDGSQRSMSPQSMTASEQAVVERLPKSKMLVQNWLERNSKDDDTKKSLSQEKTRFDDSPLQISSPDESSSGKTPAGWTKGWLTCGSIDYLDEDGNTLQENVMFHIVFYGNCLVTGEKSRQVILLDEEMCEQSGITPALVGKDVKALQEETRPGGFWESFLHAKSPKIQVFFKYDIGLRRGMSARYVTDFRLQGFWKRGERCIVSHSWENTSTNGKEGIWTWAWDEDFEEKNLDEKGSEFHLLFHPSCPSRDLVSIARGTSSTEVSPKREAQHAVPSERPGGAKGKGKAREP